MDYAVSVDLISGVSIGLEYVPPDYEDDTPSTLIIDLLILRVLIQW